MKTVTYANRSEWLEARRGGIGGSDAATLLGVSKFSSPYKLWAEKTGRDIGDFDNPYMRRGRALEPVIADLFDKLRKIGIEAILAGVLVVERRKNQHVGESGVNCR